MQAVTQLLRDNADPCDTRHNFLNEAEVEGIEYLLACLPFVEKMRESYERRHPEEVL